MKDVLEAHLRVTLHRGLEVAYEDPKAFKGAVAKLFGEYSARLLELIILQRLKEQFGWSEEPSSLEEAVERIRAIYGG
ncbi:NitrOD5 domain-containing protein [Thermococcus sp.]|uniref:NitrOD5 domain-containing protein n=1 Tax=Thermococcus sp. TaxID=35749 RepID=UPI00260B2CEC|nr:NitrOD5 domain-containing protein [Thermococcus sp.]